MELYYYSMWYQWSVGKIMRRVENNTVRLAQESNFVEDLGRREYEK